MKYKLLVVVVALVFLSGCTSAGGKRSASDRSIFEAVAGSDFGQAVALGAKF